MRGMASNLGRRPGHGRPCGIPPFRRRLFPELQRREAVAVDGRHHGRHAVRQVGAHVPADLAVRVCALVLECEARGHDEVACIWLYA